MSDDAGRDQAPSPGATAATPETAAGPTRPRRIGPITSLLADLAAMVRFYSRLPVPRLGPADDPAAPPPFGRAIRMLPWASLVIAAPGALVATAAAPSGLPDLAVGALSVATAAWVCGAFHEDGLADVADGFGGGATVERRLAIMKDSRIGAFGGTALAAQFVLRASLIGEAVDRFDGVGAGLAILAVAATARVLPLGLMVLLPPARPDGLGRAAGRPERGALVGAGIGTAIVLAAGLGPLVGAEGIAATVGCAAAALVGLGATARAKIGGFTGDVVGAGTLLAEIAALVGLLL